VTLVKIARMLRLLVIIIITFMINSANAQSSPKYLINKLSEAEDYLRVKPTASSKILKKHLDQIGLLSIKEQLTWHQNLLRASISLNDLRQVESTVRVMFSYPELEKETDKFVSLLSSLGIFLRRSGHPQESIFLFDCGLKQPIKKSKQKISLLISKGNSLSYLEKYNQAKDIYTQALKIAKEDTDEVSISSIYNTLGIMALKEENYTLAKKYLIDGLQLSQKISRRSGQIVAGLQLLRLSILSNDPMLYDRLHYRISRLILASDSEVRKAYLFWIEKAHQVSKGHELSVQEQETLIQNLKLIESTSIGLYNQLVDKLAKPLGVISAPIIKEYSAYQGNLLKQIPQCKVSY
jgi:tetratricopeptide (TPR) repeat protein